MTWIQANERYAGEHNIALVQEYGKVHVYKASSKKDMWGHYGYAELQEPQTFEIYAEISGANNHAHDLLKAARTRINNGQNVSIDRIIRKITENEH